MPLLAPPPTTNSNDQRKGGADLADRLELEDETPELPEEKADKPEFVHIATKRRCERVLSLLPPELGLKAQVTTHVTQPTGITFVLGTSSFPKEIYYLESYSFNGPCKRSLVTFKEECPPTLTNILAFQIR